MAAGLSGGQRRGRTPGGRAVRVVVRVTTEEYTALAAHAQDAGLTVPSYLATLGLHPDEAPIAELRSALTYAAALRRLLTVALSRSDQQPTTIPDAAGGLSELSRQAEATVRWLDTLAARHR